MRVPILYKIRCLPTEMRGNFFPVIRIYSVKFKDLFVLTLFKEWVAFGLYNIEIAVSNLLGCFAWQGFLNEVPIHAIFSMKLLNLVIYLNIPRASISAYKFNVIFLWCNLSNASSALFWVFIRVKCLSNEFPVAFIALKRFEKNFIFKSTPQVLVSLSSLLLRYTFEDPLVSTRNTID